MRPVAVHRLGRVGYASSQALQRSLAAQVRSGVRGDTLLLLEHPPVFTLGRVQQSAANVLASPEEIAAAGASVHQSERGGNVTFHGPGQLVAYPILDLGRFRKSVHWYVEALEDTLIGTAGAFGVSARRGGDGETGVWVTDRKIGAIGVSVSRWVTSHGVALNAETDLRFFDMIVPCGLHHNTRVTSLSREVGRGVSVSEAAPPFLDAFARIFECELVDAPEMSLEEEVCQAAEAVAAPAPAAASSAPS